MYCIGTVPVNIFCTLRRLYNCCQINFVTPSAGLSNWYQNERTTSEEICTVFIYLFIHSFAVMREKYPESGVIILKIYTTVELY